MSDWLSVMSVIPLASGVPVVTAPGPGRQVRAIWTGSGVAGAVPRLRQLTPERGWRVDLENPQGFAYALRLWWRKAPQSATLLTDGHIVRRWIDNETTAEDRFSLAIACAEVRS